MGPAARLNALIASTTVTLMFVAITQLAPLIVRLAIRWQIASSLAALLTSAGVYRLITLGIDWLLNRSTPVKKLIFGSHFVHGTWVGWFEGHAHDKRFVVEHIEQDLDGIVINGRSYTADGQPHANWTSGTVTLDPRRSRLIFTYIVDIGTREVSVQGITSVQLQRRATHKPPEAYAGYAHDLNDPQRIHIQEEKISDELTPWSEALLEATGRFPQVRP